MFAHTVTPLYYIAQNRSQIGTVLILTLKIFYNEMMIDMDTDYMKTEDVYSNALDEYESEDTYADYLEPEHKKSAGQGNLPDVHEIEDTTDWESNAYDNSDDEDGEVDSTDTDDENVLLHSIVKHENKRYALVRKERGARTEEDFEKLVQAYDGIDTNREKREKRYEKISTELLSDFILKGHQTIIPAPLKHTWWKELLRGDFLDVIHDCPYDIQEFFGSRILYELVEPLKDTQKEVLYYRDIRYWSNQRIAAMREQTDRNILKTYETLIESLRYKLYMRLLPRYKAEEAKKARAEERVKLEESDENNDAAENGAIVTNEVEDAENEVAKDEIAKNEITKYKIAKDEIEMFPLTYNQRRFVEENKEKYGDGKPKRSRRTKAEIEKAAIESTESKK